ncbi:hypothetical protein QQS21_005918 [Conoideocrella luteorostrata]|uniref:Uncharacterized protein n=1 Tax=Conoideocrella luteorostrata TaxID=1105319 RepID=A0AAJ0FTY2_9HYPO|nr:hypothetical protein QQS21_005918 [Conoideocrella luteorostrata]
MSRSADELAQYVVPAQRQPSNISNMTAEAQQKDLYGVGTSPDFVNPQPDMAYAKEITNLPHNQADDPPTQRYDMIHSDVLASTNVFRSPMEQTFIDPELLGHENIDVATGPSLHGKQDTGMQDNFVNSTGSLTQASQAHRIGEDILHQPHVSNKTGTYEFAMDLDDTEEYVSNPLELSNSTGEMTGASQQEVTASSSQHVNTNQSSAPYSLAIAQPSPSNSQEVVKWLGKNHPEILQAALNARPPGGDDGSTAETNSTPKALNHQCRDCQKLFKRPCELTYVSELS